MPTKRALLVNLTGASNKVLTLGLLSRSGLKKPSAKEVKTKFKAQSGECAFCHFPAKLALRPVAHLKGWVLACPLCADSCQLDLAKKRPGGHIIYSDLFTQEQVNIIVHMAWCFRTLHPEHYRNSVYDVTTVKFRNLTYETKKHFEDGFDRVDVLSAVLEDLSKPVYEEREQNLKGLLYFPHYDSYKKQTSYWKENVYPAYESLMQGDAK